MNRRDLIRSGSVSDPWGWLLVAMLCSLAGAGQALLVSGCGPSTRYRSSPHVWETRPHTTRPARSGGVRVLLPVWVRLHPGEEAAALAEVYSVTLEFDHRIDPALRGVPLSATVVVLDPGAYYAPYSPTGLASGEQWGSALYVAWRGTPSGVRLPALAHELRHLLTGDPNAGHGVDVITRSADGRGAVRLRAEVTR